MTIAIPLIDTIYGIDIETKPLPQYENKKYCVNEYNEENEFQPDSPALYPWHSEVYGLAISWGENPDETTYFTGLEIKKAVEFLSKNKIKLVGHNIFFDWCHLYYHFEKPLNFVADSGVYSQCINNSDYIISFGLKQTVERLYNIESQEKEIKQYLKETYKISAGSYGAYIHLCPTEMVEKYCKLDAYYTRKICLDAKKWLKSDVTLYLQIYLAEVKLTILQFIEGIEVDRPNFLKEKELLADQISVITDKFLNHPELSLYIQQIQLNKFEKANNLLKKKKLDWEEWSKKPDNQFNVNSGTQLKQLFDMQGLHWNEDKKKFIYPYLNTFPGTKLNNPDSPKLGTKFLHAYGIGGEILADKGEKITLLSHIDRALDESEFDGHIHPHINLLGTKTGRISGSGVNIIATPISDEIYGKNLVMPKGWSLIARDFFALEPTIFANLSDDPVLKYVNYEGQGKEPYIEDDVLWIDDNYLMACYAAPFMRNELMDKIDLTNWVKDSEGEKKKVKHLRSVAKTIVLSTNYGAAPLKVQATIREQLKLTIPTKNIQQFQEAYWASLSVAAQYKRSLEMEAQEKGYIINIGGYPLTFFDRPGGIIKGAHKALNKMLQSSAAIVMKTLLYYIYPHVKNRRDIIPQVCDWHDCCFFKVKNDVIGEANSIIDLALTQLNDTLNLPLKFRLDCHIGRNFYECK